MGHRGVFSLVLAVCACATAFGQGTTSRVLGSVQDSSGAVVPNASVKLVNEGTRVTFDTTQPNGTPISNDTVGIAGTGVRVTAPLTFINWRYGRWSVHADFIYKHLFNDGVVFDNANLLPPHAGTRNPTQVVGGLTLGAVLIGPIARLTRTAVLEVLGADFVRTARAKGLRETVVIVHHALRNAMIPVVTLIGLQAAFLLGGAVVTETMFSWPGVGRLAVGAIVSSDFPTAQGAIMILAIAFLTINLLVDVLYVYLDPRLQSA
jgi:hypothetical protein